MLSSETSVVNKSRTNPIWLFALIIVFVLGLAGWLNFVFHGESPRAWHALLINFVFFTPLAAGMIVWPAVVMLSQGIWARTIERYAFAALAFAPLTIIVFIVLWFGNSHWAIWAVKPDSHLGIWLNPTFLFSRDIIALLIFWILAALFVIKARRSVPTILAGWLSFAYGVVFTLLGFDLVMSLDPRWYSTLFGWYFFVSGMYAALAVWTLVVIFNRRATTDQRHDLGKLIVAGSLLTTYMMFSQLLPIWYENFSHEAKFVILRLNISDWRYISFALLVTVYLGPLVLLLTRWSKRSPAFLAAVSFLVLAGLWVERWWLVTPTLNTSLEFDLPEISITASFVAAFIICLRWIPVAERHDRETVDER
jgi:hypothetical protein